MSVWYSHSIRDGMKPLCIEIIYDGRYPRDETGVIGFSVNVLGSKAERNGWDIRIKNSTKKYGFPLVDEYDLNKGREIKERIDKSGILRNHMELSEMPCYFCDVDVEVSDYDPRFIVIRWKIYFKFLNPDIKVDVNNIAFWRHGDVTVDRYPADKNVSKAITKIIREKISERFQTTGERVVYIRNSKINKNPKYIDPTVWRV